MRQRAPESRVQKHDPGRRPQNWEKTREVKSCFLFWLWAVFFVLWFGLVASPVACLLCGLIALLPVCLFSFISCVSRAVVLLCSLFGVWFLSTGTMLDLKGIPLCTFRLASEVITVSLFAFVYEYEDGLRSEQDRCRLVVAILTITRGSR